MKKLIHENQISMLCLLLFAGILFADNFFIDSISLALLGVCAIGVSIHKIFVLILFFLRKRGVREVFDFNFLVSLAVVVIAFFLASNSNDVFKSERDALINCVETCTYSTECRAMVNGVKIEKKNDKTFSITSGVITLLVKVSEDKDGCLWIHSMSTSLINVKRCSLDKPT